MVEVLEGLINVRMCFTTFLSIPLIRISFLYFLALSSRADHRLTFLKRFYCTTKRGTEDRVSSDSDTNMPDNHCHSS